MDSVIDREQLKRARGLRTLNDVGKAVGVTRQQIWNYENGASEIPLAMLSQLADLYGVRLEKLLVQKNLTETSNLS